MNITIDLKDYQIIRGALMKLPAETVYELIAKLDSQVVSQQEKLPMAKGVN